MIPVTPSTWPIFDTKNWPQLWQNSLLADEYRAMCDLLSQKGEFFNEIIIDGDFCYALDIGESRIVVYSKSVDEIGSIDMDDGWLASINVDAHYQRRGIGTKLIALAIKWCDLSQIPAVYGEDTYAYSLNAHSAALIASCIKKGIVDRSMLETDVPFSENADTERSHGICLALVQYIDHRKL